MFNSFTY